MKKLVLMSVAVLGLSVSAWAAGYGNIESLQLRVAHDAPTETSEKMPLVHSGDGIKELLFVDRKTLVSEKDVAAAEVVRGGNGQARLDLDLSPAGRQELARVAKKDAGRRVALIVDGRAVGTGTLEPEYSAGKLAVTGDFSEAEAHQIADKINGARK
ncbi:MAG TPA: hypothetical protein VHB20_08920 [Verrucomicrobiae bacterium]|jgi:preprotein translocase subunit SecD|nr:hypothetical protein [Verrucomicrobiae bacterium]